MRFLRTLRAGLALAVLRRPRLDGAGPTAGQFWLLALLGTGLACAVSFWRSETPRYFEIDALQSEAYGIALLLLFGFLSARTLSRRPLQWQLPALLAAAGLVTYGVNSLVYDLALPVLEAESDWYALYYYFSLIWWALIVWRALGALAPGRFFRIGLLTVAVTAAHALSWQYLDYQEFWQPDYQARYERELEQGLVPPPLDAEGLLYRQAELLGKQLDRLPAERPGVPDLYFVAFGGYGGQNVFLNEVLYTNRLFQQKFQAGARTVMLVNNRGTTEDFPLATATNLRESLTAIAGRIDPEEDILFLFLTSHGSRDHELSVELDRLPLQSLSAERLAEILRAVNIKWKVVVVSACYSGGFIEPLADPYSLIITAARPDRNSFGCSNDADLTYFGRAFFEHALNETASFVDAFHKARALVGEWEAAEDYTPSEPQMASSPLIEARLAQWRATLGGAEAQVTER